MNLGGVDHVWFWVTDMDRAVTFYRDAVGLGVVSRHGNEWAELDAGSIRLGLHGAGEGRPVPHGGTAVFRVDDLDVAKAALEGRGVAFEEPSRRGAGDRAVRLVRRPGRELDATDRVRLGGRLMARRVAVVGAGMTRFVRRAQETGKELSWEASREALASCELSLDGRRRRLPDERS